MADEKKNVMDRRGFLKASGAAGAALGAVGLGISSYQAGRDPATYTGWESWMGAGQTFPRKRFALKANGSPHEKIGPTRRIDARTEVIFSRFPSLSRQWREEEGLSSLDPLLQEYYREHPEDLETDLTLRRDIMPKLMEDRKKYSDQFLLAQAWSAAMGSVAPPPVNQPPEVSDFPRRGRGGATSEPVKLKDPARTSKLIKQVAYQFGAILVGITRLNPDWVYQYPMRGRGFDVDQPIAIPAHWEYAVVIGTPMSWDPMFANPNYGTSDDAYSRSRIVAHRVATFIKQLGYPARTHTPGTSYDLVVPPIAIDAGFGEQGRHSICITPELGANCRPAIITTNIPLATDRPIKFGVEDFCAKCLICAEQCPSGAIPKGGPVESRGYRMYRVDVSKCYSFWNSNLGNIGCRICVSCCPYTRKSNWLHRSALHLTANDPTGLSHDLLIRMQKGFYPVPDPQDYYIPSLGGKNASYRKPPWWLRSEDFIDF